MKRAYRFGVILAAVLTVTLAGAAILRSRETQRRVECSNNLKMIGLGLHEYHDAFGAFPPGTVPNPALRPEQRLSWIVAAWSFVGDGQIHLNIDREKAWDDPVNRKPTGHSGVEGPASTSELYSPGCPEGRDTLRERSSRTLQYVGVGGVGIDAPTLPMGHPRAGVFGYDRTTRRDDIKDGLTTTMMVIETARDLGPWTAGGPKSVRGVDPARQPYIGRGRQFGGNHRGGVNVLYADGSVRFVKESIWPPAFEAAATAAGGETAIVDDSR
jgi:prepilin-type processing-associated H-X9-DG protein